MFESLSKVYYNLAMLSRRIFLFISGALFPNLSILGIKPNVKYLVKYTVLFPNEMLITDFKREQDSYEKVSAFEYITKKFRDENLVDVSVQISPHKIERTYIFKNKSTHRAWQKEIKKNGSFSKIKANKKGFQIIKYETWVV